MIKFQSAWFLQQGSAMTISKEFVMFYTFKFADKLGVTQANAWNYGSLLI